MPAGPTSDHNSHSETGVLHVHGRVTRVSRPMQSTIQALTEEGPEAESVGAGERIWGCRVNRERVPLSTIHDAALQCILQNTWAATMMKGDTRRCGWEALRRWELWKDNYRLNCNIAIAKLGSSSQDWSVSVPHGYTVSYQQGRTVRASL